ncbi:hypothetical protein [Paenibacillus sp. FSL E2-0178]|uniref:hypothetical protein n=1 Tax=Paenibacillus sp. FSL E2-0178 TaxID=2921361 RepID=UPI00315909AD
MMNTIIIALIGLPSAIPVIQFGLATVIDYILVWLGVFIAMHSFPCTGDAKNIWSMYIIQLHWNFSLE